MGQILTLTKHPTSLKYFLLLTILKKMFNKIKQINENKFILISKLSSFKVIRHNSDQNFKGGFLILERYFNFIVLLL